MSRRVAAWPPLVLAVAVVALLVGVLVATVPSAQAADSDDRVPRAKCGPGARPEPGVQGQIPRAQRISGDSTKGYWCNLKLVGQYQGTGGGIVSPIYGHCAYLGTANTGILSGNPGVQVVDASNPAKPRRSAVLGSTAFSISTWESLKVHEGRQLLVGAGVQSLPGIGVGALDVYDVGRDCATPTLLNGTGIGQLTQPIFNVAHEGGFSPDGKTYWATSAYTGQITAIDLTDPTRPRTVYTGTAGLTNHGFSFSADGRTMYGVTAVPAGLQILDVSDIQTRKAVPQIRQVASLPWNDGLFSQMTVPFTSKGRKYLWTVDEAGNGGIRLVDVQDPAKPRIVRHVRLEIGLASSAARRSQDVGGDGLFGYESHYCTIDRPKDPTALACGYVQSGIRVFDIRRPTAPKEIAYFNPAAQKGKTLLQLPNSFHAIATYLPPVISTLSLESLADSVLRPDLTADWCMSPPKFVGRNELWVSCSDAGFLALRFTNNAFPLR
ncbi:MAG: hypothetical protein EON52_02675 [Actinomycetales bacterium]|nr:MAG: hypothetical protein EON52_02675 [Actinomycetales bacterium]